MQTPSGQSFLPFLLLQKVQLLFFFFLFSSSFLCFCVWKSKCGNGVEKEKKVSSHRTKQRHAYVSYMALRAKGSVENPAAACFSLAAPTQP